MTDENQQSQTPIPAPAPQPDQSGFDAKVKNWWINNKLMFFIALPLILMFFFRDILLAVLVGSARKTAADAKVEDADLLKKANQAAIDAAAAKQAADADQKSAADRKESDVPNDWFKKEK